MQLFLLISPGASLPLLSSPPPPPSCLLRAPCSPTSNRDENLETGIVALLYSKNSGNATREVVTAPHERLRQSLAASLGFGRRVITCVRRLVQQPAVGDRQAPEITLPGCQAASLAALPDGIGPSGPRTPVCQPGRSSLGPERLARPPPAARPALVPRYPAARYQDPAETLYYPIHTRT